MNRLYLLGLLVSLALLATDLLVRPTKPPTKSLLEVAAETEAWVYNQVSYQADVVEAWATPEQTLRRGYGDCEDLALLFAEHLRRLTGYEASIVIVHYRAHPVLLLHAEAVVAGRRFMRPLDLAPAQLRDHDLVETLSYQDAYTIARGYQLLRLRWPR